MFVPNGELGIFLLDARLLSRDDLARLLGEGGNLFDTLRARNIVQEDDLTRAASHVLGVPFGEVRHEEIDEEALTLVPEPLSRTHSVALYKIDGHRAQVMLLDLDSLEHLSYLETEHHLRPVPRLTDRASLKRALLLQQKRLKEKFAERLARSSPAQAVDALLSHALLSRAGQVYLAEGAMGELKVRYRIGASVHDAMHLPGSAKTIISLLKESAGLSHTLFAPQEGRFKLKLGTGDIVRVGVFSLPSRAGESVALSLQTEGAGKSGFTLESLGLRGESLSLMHQTLNRGEGLMLVSAPAHSGKTTTLYTLADLATSADKLTICVEEKIELPLPHVTQVGVKKELGQTLASALRSSLKHHPDILMIDELKTEDDAALAASAASRGIFVIAGIKAPSAAKAIQKMLSLGIDPLLLSAVLRGATGERLVRKLCASCREAYTPSRSDLMELENHASFAKVLGMLKAEDAVEPSLQWKDVEFYRAKGCEECESGYRGETALFEVLPVSSITKELILDTKSEREEQEAHMVGGVPLNLAEDGLLKAALGLTTIEEVKESIGE